MISYPQVRRQHSVTPGRSGVSTTVEKAIADRDRRARNYRAAKKRLLEEQCADPVWGERLRKFAATLNHFGPDDADRMVAYVKREACWLRHEVPDDIRFTALQLIGDRIVRIRQKMGLVPFDDPLGHEPDDVFRLCKTELGL